MNVKLTIFRYDILLITSFINRNLLIMIVKSNIKICEILKY